MADELFAIQAGFGRVGGGGQDVEQWRSGRMGENEIHLGKELEVTPPEEKRDIQEVAESNGVWRTIALIAITVIISGVAAYLFLGERVSALETKICGEVVTEAELKAAMLSESPYTKDKPLIDYQFKILNEKLDKVIAYQEAHR